MAEPSTTFIVLTPDGYLDMKATVNRFNEGMNPDEALYESIFRAGPFVREYLAKVAKWPSAVAEEEEALAVYARLAEFVRSVEQAAKRSREGAPCRTDSGKHALQHAKLLQDMVDDKKLKKELAERFSGYLQHLKIRYGVPDKPFEKGCTPVYF